MLLSIVEIGIGQHVPNVWIAGSVNICMYFLIMIPGMRPDISKCIVFE